MDSSLDSGLRIYRGKCIWGEEGPLHMTTGSFFEHYSLSTHVVLKTEPHKDLKRKKEDINTLVFFAACFRREKNLLLFNISYLGFHIATRLIYLKCKPSQASSHLDIEGQHNMVKCKFLS